MRRWSVRFLIAASLIKLCLDVGLYFRASESVPSPSLLPFGGTVQRCDNNTSIIITTNMVPSFPSTEIIDGTLASLKLLEGLCLSNIIISIDGMNQHDINIRYKNATQRLAQFRQNLAQKYPHLTILQHPKRVRIAMSVHLAMELVTTEFVYVLQHDMPFLQPVPHSKIIQTMRQYPNILRLVRFNLIANFPKEKTEGPETCYNESTPVNHVNGLDFIKTPVWSDNNHLTRKSYYDTMHDYFLTLPQYPKAMERGLLGVSRANCSYWGSFIYGKKGLAPMVGHLDGRAGMFTNGTENTMI